MSDFHPVRTFRSKVRLRPIADIGEVDQNSSMKLLSRVLTVLIVVALAVAGLGYLMPTRFGLVPFFIGVVLLFLSTVLLGVVQLVQTRQGNVGQDPGSRARRGVRQRGR